MVCWSVRVEIHRRMIGDMFTRVRLCWFFVVADSTIGYGYVEKRNLARGLGSEYEVVRGLGGDDGFFECVVKSWQQSWRFTIIWNIVRYFFLWKTISNDIMGQIAPKWEKIERESWKMSTGKEKIKLWIDFSIICFLVCSKRSLSSCIGNFTFENSKETHLENFKKSKSSA